MEETRLLAGKCTLLCLEVENAKINWYCSQADVPYIAVSGS
jgi:hypothetical protein